MPDPIDNPLDALDNFDVGAPLHPLPAAEVRRRGERWRRRQTALTGVGAALAVAAIVTPLALLGNDDARSLPPTDRAPGPASTVLRVPDVLDLTVDMPLNESGEPVRATRGGVGLSELGFCDSGQPLQDDGRVDSLSAAASGPEYAETRELVVYPDVARAQAVLDELTDAARACPREASGPQSVTLHAVSNPDLGEAATVVVATYETDGTLGLGAEVVQLVRVGNALLATSEYGESDPQRLEPLLIRSARAIAPVVEQMALFGPDSVSEPPDETVGESEELTGTALLTVGEVPVRDRLGPWTEVPAAEAPPTLACLPQGLAALEASAVVTRSFRAQIAPDGVAPTGDTYASAVNVAVLQYVDEAGADYGYEVAQGMVAACNADLMKLRPQGGSVEVPPYGSWRTWTYGATDICTSCDAFRFDRMGAAVVGDRLVLVSLAEVGGPQEPEGLDATMSALMDAAIAQATPDPSQTSPKSR